jgi:hypothetical protein
LNTIYLPFILRLADIGNSFNVTSNDPLVMDRCSQCATFNPFTTEAYDWSVRRLAVDSANDSVADGLLSVQTDRPTHSHTQTKRKTQQQHAQLLPLSLLDSSWFCEIDWLISVKNITKISWRTTK